MTISQTRPPVWDLTAFFDQFDSASFRAYREGIQSDLEALAKQSGALTPLTSEVVEAWASVICEFEGVVTRLVHLSSYLSCANAADAFDEGIKREQGTRAELWAELSKIEAQLKAGLREVDEGALEALIAEPRLKNLGAWLRRLRKEASWVMDERSEALVADLGVTGFSAWGRLYNQLTARLEFDLEVEGRPSERVPFARKRSLTEDPDAAVREAALRGSNAALMQHEEALTTALNSIAGTRLTLYQWRGVPHFLDVALFESAISRETLDAMLGAIEKRRDLARRYLVKKAARLGKTRLGFQDLRAPLPRAEPAVVDWGAAQRHIIEAFGGYHEDLGAFAQHAFDARWVEAEPRAGKRPGAFCTSSIALRESRVFMSYNDTLGDVLTLAHELGHAFHNWVMRDMRPLARSYPKTLAETASTFAEALLCASRLADPAILEEERAEILDIKLARAVSFLLDTPMRYEFERKFYEARTQGEVSTSALNEMMLEAQRESFGDSLDVDALDPLFWASKLHFFLTGTSFYNFPYSFGYLFSTHVFMRAQEEGPAFYDTYIELLRETSNGTAEEIAQRVLGVDITQEKFWLDAIQPIEEDLAAFEALGRTGA